MSVKFSVPSSPAKQVYEIKELQGVDLTNKGASVEDDKSPNAPNMIRDVPGKVRKRMGFTTVKTFSGTVYAFHYLTTKSKGIIHVGDRLYDYDTEKMIYSGMNTIRSKSWQFEDKLYIADGKQLLCYDGTTVYLATDKAYIPTLTIAKAPAGGGTDYEALNLLQPGFIELFAGTATDTAYHLSFGGLDSDKVKVWILNSAGGWTAYTEGNQFTVDRTAGIITFTTAPGKSVLTGEDNVKIEAFRTVSNYADRINKCRFGMMFGINGATDRLFLSGNPEHKNYDWYSGQYDPTYWPDTGYSTMGSDASAIMGYSIINNYLACHKDSNETTQSILLRSGDLVDDKPAFKLINTLQGAGALTSDAFGYLCTEPLFLTKLGIFAVTAQDITGEKYAQNRSYYINGELLKESNLDKCFAFVYKDMYLLCVNNTVYVLDGLQPIQTDKSAPYATRQYACFYLKDIPANCMWTIDSDTEDALYFGTTDGKVCKFFTDPDSINSYNDDGKAISALWETPDVDGKLFYKNKSFRYIAIRMKNAQATSVDIYSQVRGVWSLIKSDHTTCRYIVFSALKFSIFSFSSDLTQRVVSSKTRIKKVDKVKFRFKNEVLNEPFGVYDIALEYVQGGNSKG
jgi:hypothetical protein